MKKGQSLFELALTLAFLCVSHGSYWRQKENTKINVIFRGIFAPDCTHRHLPHLENQWIQEMR